MAEQQVSTWDGRERRRPDSDWLLNYERRMTSVEMKLDILVEQKDMLAEIFKRLTALETEIEKMKTEKHTAIGFASVLAGIGGAVVGWIVNIVK